MGLSALEAGQPAIFSPGQPERETLLRVAVSQTTGEGKTGTMTASIQHATQPVADLPSFSVNP